MLESETCTGTQLMELLRGNAMLALLDVREQGEFFGAHILRASNVPAGRMELLAPVLVPRQHIPVIVYDDGGNDTRALRALRSLQQLGYTNVARLAGGLAQWQAEGRLVVDGTSCMTKGYAECLEREAGTPRISPEEILARVARGEKVVLVDIRTPEEFKTMSIPGGVLAPGCEAAYRFKDIAPDPDTLVVTNCGARTRGILCAQLLRDMGVPNPVAYMSGGTMEWRLSGNALEYGRENRPAPPSFEAMHYAHARAGELAREYGIEFLDGDTLARWRGQEEPLYIFDVRQPEEYEAGHLEGSRSAPGCQLVQLSDDLAAVRQARFVLVDDTEARAVFTAYWLKQLGIANVFVLKGGLGGAAAARGKLVRGPEAGVEPHVPQLPDYSVAALEAAMRGTRPPLIINVGSSVRHRAGHIPGAVWVPRLQLESVLGRCAANRVVVLAADTPQHALLAANDLKKLLPDIEAGYFTGTADSWRDAGYPLETGMQEDHLPENDSWYLWYKDPDITREAAKGYLDWEDILADQLMADKTLAYMTPDKLKESRNG